MTQSLQRGILRVSEIFGYDEKEYPERMLQRAAGWCECSRKTFAEWAAEGRLNAKASRR